MGRKKKLINKTNIPQYAVERFARCVFDDIRADYAKPEIQAEFQRWLAEREQHKKTRAAKTAALVSVMGNKQIIRTRFRFGRYGSDYFALVRRKGLEPPTYWFVASHSIQLSYRRMAHSRCSHILPYEVGFVKHFFTNN